MQHYRFVLRTGGGAAELQEAVLVDGLSHEDAYRTMETLFDFFQPSKDAVLTQSGCGGYVAELSSDSFDVIAIMEEVTPDIRITAIRRVG